MNRVKIPKPKKFQQNHDVAVHFHPRRLARQICHARAEHSGATGVTKVHPNTTKSAFARNWKNDAESFAR